MPNRTEPDDGLIKRFWARVSETEGCWEWTGGRTPKGYGLLLVEGRKVYAHRFSYARFVGPIPDGLLVCHHCDNPPCVRPDHFFLGSNTDNMRDASRKGRLVGSHPAGRGAAHHHAKLTEADVREIRRRGDEGESYAGIARAFHIAPSTSRGIVLRMRWGHVQ